MKRKKRERKQESQEPAYLSILRAMHAAGKLQAGVHHVEVYHDDWCAMNRGGTCNCEPTILARKVGGELIPDFVQ